MKHRISEHGMALVGVLVVLSFLMALGAALTVTVMSDTQLRGAFANSVTGFYAAESGLNKGMGEYKNIFLDWRVPQGADFNPNTFTIGTRQVTYKIKEVSQNTIVIPSGQTFGGLSADQRTYTVLSSAAVGQDVEASVGAEFNIGQIPLFQFVAFYNRDLEILPGQNMFLQGRVHTNGNLYVNSEDGVSLTIQDNRALGITNVQVTSQSKIYRGRKNVTNQCLGSVTIDKLEDKVNPKPDWDPQILPCNGSNTRQVPVSELATWKGSIVSEIQNISVPMPDVIVRGTGEFWQDSDLRIALRLDQKEIIPAGPGGVPAVSPNLYAIEVQDANGSRNVAKTNALRNFMRDVNYNTNLGSFPGTRPIFFTDIPLSGAGCGCTNATPACSHTLAQCYLPIFAQPTSLTTPDANRVYTNTIATLNMANSQDYRRGGFYNWRERQWMILLNINVYDLIDWNARNGEPFFATDDYTFGGLVIFATVIGPNSNGINNYGVRVFGSRNLPYVGKKPYPSVTGIGAPGFADPSGVTVVSDQAMYVVGDFNRADATLGDNRQQPAALIGDSINVLSENYWRGRRGDTTCPNPCATFNDAQSPLTLASRPGANTIINAAFLGGVDDTTLNNYNGGLENYPRFHQSWGSALQYRGSFVSLGTPVHVNGAWCGTGGSSASGCNIYDPPQRNFNYDPAFNLAQNLPPHTPRFVYVQQVLFTEDFK